MAEIRDVIIAMQIASHPRRMRHDELGELFHTESAEDWEPDEEDQGGVFSPAQTPSSHPISVLSVASVVKKLTTLGASADVAIRQVRVLFPVLQGIGHPVATTVGNGGHVRDSKERADPVPAHAIASR